MQVTNQTHPPLPTFSYPDYRDFRDRNHVFSALAAYRLFPMSLSRDGRSQRLWGYVVTGNYFDTLREGAFLGRVLAPADDRLEHANPVAVTGTAGSLTTAGCGGNSSTLAIGTASGAAGTANGAVGGASNGAAGG